MIGLEVLSSTRAGAVDAWLGADDAELDECSECGHLHFDVEQREYVPCPLATEGCTCALGLFVPASHDGIVPALRTKSSPDLAHETLP